MGSGALCPISSPEARSALWAGDPGQRGGNTSHSLVGVVVALKPIPKFGLDQMSPTHVNAVASTSRADPYADYPSTAQSDWSTASNALKRTRTDGTTSTRRGPLPPGQLITTSDQPKTYSRLKQQVLSEEDYLTGLEDVILRDFFPQLATLTAQEDMRRAVDSGDDKQVQSSLRRMHELCTPTPKRQVKGESSQLARPEWRHQPRRPS